jgi:hypothetical protein
MTAQTTVYLRSGGPATFKSISAASNTTPISITTTEAHGLQAGDLVYIQQVYGNWAANGLRRVSGADPTTFQISDINGNPIAGNGDYTFSGFVGKVEPHVLKPHPRLMLDGPDGALTAAMDGSSGKSSRASSSSPAYQALASLNDGRTGTADSNPLLKKASLEWGPYAFLEAMGWFMDRSKTSWLNAAKYMLNNVEKRLANGTTATQFWPGPFSASAYGRGSDLDWSSHVSVPYMYAYSIIRDQMTPAEQQAFASKILNNSTDYGESCTLPIEWQPGTISISAGSTTVTGTGTDFTQMAGRAVWAYLPPTSKAYNLPMSWATMPAILNATKMTLATAAAADVSGALFAAVRPWQPGDCGWRWYVREHNYSPMFDRRKLTVTLTGAVGAADTTFMVQGLPPKQPPYAMTVPGGEFFLVTAHSGPNQLTVQRGYLNTTPLALDAGTGIVVADPEQNFMTPGAAQVNPDLVPYDDPRHNLVIAKLYGYMMAGLALADDDERARLMFEQAFNYWYDFVYPYDKRSWTGITQSAGNPGYNRRHLWNMMLARSFLNSMSPAVDVTDGDWLKNAFLYYPALEIPGYPFGIWPFAESQVDYAFAFRHLEGLMVALGMFPDDVRAQKFNWWLRTRKNLWTTSVFTQTPELLMYAMLLPGPGETQIGQIDYTQIDPPHFTLNQVDLADSRQSPLSVWTSRTDWGEKATSILALSLQRPNDHTGGYPGPGAYKIAKGPKILAGDAGQAATNPFSRQWSNYLETGGVHTPGGITAIDRSSGNASYAYIRVNNSAAYPSSLGVQRAYRHLLHIKGNVDTILAYDEMQTNDATAKTQNFWFYSENSETPSLNLNGCSAVYTRPNTRLVTRYLLPSTATCQTQFVEGNPYAIGKYKLNGIAMNAGNASNIQVLAVHKAFSDTSSDMAPTSMLSTAGSHDGVLIGGSAPAIALFPRNGTTPFTSVSFQSQHAGTAFIAVAGMAPGDYAVSINGGTPASYPADVSGILPFSGPAGSYAIVRTSLSVPLSIGTASVPDMTLSADYYIQLSVLGGTPPYRWRLSSGTLPTGINLNEISGEIRGVPSQTGTFPVTISLQDAAGSLADRIYTLNVVTGAVRIITDSLPDGVRGEPYSVALTATGGQSPYTWTLTGGALPAGLQLKPEGVIEGEPEEASSSQIVLTVTDSAGSTASIQPTLTIEESESQYLEVKLEDVTSHKAILRYGYAGLKAGERCQVEVSRDSKIKHLTDSVVDAGGRAPRFLVVGQRVQLTPDTRYWTRVSCEVGHSTAKFKTPVERAANSGQLTISIPPMIRSQPREVVVNYGNTPDLGNTVTKRCAVRCTVSIPAQTDEVIYVRLVYRDAAGHQIASAAVRPVALQ